MTPSTPDPAVLARLRSDGDLASRATRLMDESLPWFRELGPQERSWVSLVAQAGISAFFEWIAEAKPDTAGLAAEVFGAAPRDLARVISLEQTVDLVRTTVSVVETAIDDVPDETQQAAMRLAILRYSREIAFSAAQVYARAAEARGAWDARVEALVIDALLRDEVDNDVLARLGALGWSPDDSLLVLAGSSPISGTEGALDVMRRSAGNHHLDLITGIHAATLLTVVGIPSSIPTATMDERMRVARLLTPHFGPGPVVVSDLCSSLADVPDAARSTLSALRAAWGWPDAPRPVAVSELLPERALLGEAVAVEALVSSVYDVLLADAGLYDTACAYLERSPSLEATARTLFVHPNTVRYRLRRIAEVTGWSPTDARGAFTLRLALTLGRLQA